MRLPAKMIAGDAHNADANSLERVSALGRRRIRRDR